MQEIQPQKRPPGRPRSGKMWAHSSISLETQIWARLDALAKAHGKTRYYMLRLAVEKGVDALENAERA